MSTQNILVEMGDCKRRRCALVSEPVLCADGGKWARASHKGKEFDIVDLWGVWLKRSVWDHICIQVGASGRSHRAASQKFRKQLSQIKFTDEK